MTVCGHKWIVRASALVLTFQDVCAASVRPAHHKWSRESIYADSCAELQRTSKLVQRLLDSHIIKSCSEVFEAFDETLMFRYEIRRAQSPQTTPPLLILLVSPLFFGGDAPHNLCAPDARTGVCLTRWTTRPSSCCSTRKHAIARYEWAKELIVWPHENSEGDEPSMHETLKRQFKGVFQNISSVMDCISCQKCKLHGKLQLLGLGTALKILLLPEQLISTSLSRLVERFCDLERLLWTPPPGGGS